MSISSLKTGVVSPSSLLAGNTAFNPVKATGGTIVLSGGYVYHTFTSSGTFAPTTALTADILVVSGGGGGNLNGRIGAGGGAGALLYTESLSFSTAQTVTVGGGGSASGDSNGGDGSTSSIGSNSVSVVNGSVFNNYEGDGGNSKKVISGTTTNYTGGPKGAYNGTYRLGGAGASAAANGVTNNPPTGANGINTYSSWASATSTGDSGYYAGGGAGGYEYNGTIAKVSGGLGGGGKGGAGTVNYNAEAGTANTGGGGGGCGGMGGVIGGVSAAGGSGIVIVRYAA